MPTFFPFLCDTRILQRTLYFSIFSLLPNKRSETFEKLFNVAIENCIRNCIRLNIQFSFTCYWFRIWYPLGCRTILAISSSIFWGYDLEKFKKSLQRCQFRCEAMAQKILLPLLKYCWSQWLFFIRFIINTTKLWKDSNISWLFDRQLCMWGVIIFSFALGKDSAELTRTTNTCESFHIQFNDTFYKSGPKIIFLLTNI